MGSAATRHHADYVKANSVYRKGFHTKHSIPLEERAAGNKWHSKHGRPSFIGTVEDGSAVRLIWELFLGVLREWKYLERIDVDRRTGLIPKAARDTTKFHREYWYDFQAICGQPFTTLSQANQYAALKKFLWKKFSTDPSGKAMVPPTGTKAKELSWVGFWLTEREVDSIIEAVMSSYLQQRPGS